MSAPEPERPAETTQDRRDLSRLLYDAWDLLDMYGDLINDRTGGRDPHIDRTRDELAAYRATRGWSSNGYGGES